MGKIYELPRKLEFKRVSNEHQDYLNEVLADIKNTEDLIIQADKTRNHYRVEPAVYDKLLQDEITKDYKKTSRAQVKQVNAETAEIAAQLGLDDRMEIFQESEAFFSVKDHKSGFKDGVVKLRLLNPAKTDLGVILKKILEEKISATIAKTGLNSWSNTAEALKWFQELPNSKNMTFISYDIANHYPSVQKKTLDKAFKFIEETSGMTDQEKNIIMQARKSFLFKDGQPYIKKDSNGNFDVTMGSFDSCQICEIVGLFLLSEIAKFIPPSQLGLYRDDGLAGVAGNGREINQIEQKLIRTFKEHGFKLEILHSKTVEFLDVKLDMEKKEFRPFRKPNDEPLYIHNSSNHAPTMKKAIFKSVEKRLTSISSNEKVFDEEKPIYEAALKRSEFDHKLRYQHEEQVKPKRKRRRKVIYFTPPWSDNIKTPVGKIFLQLIDSCFPRGHPLKKFYNRYTLKVSYCTMKNLKAHVATHNRKILNQYRKSQETEETEEPSKTCNCRIKKSEEHLRKEICPLGGYCLEAGIVYQADIYVNGKIVKIYYGQTSRHFKLRYYEHKMAMKNEGSKHATALSNFIHKLKKEGVSYVIKWSIKARASHYKSGSRKCMLCIKEKVAIALEDPKLLLNNRSELLNKCIHHINVELRKHSS